MKKETLLAYTYDFLSILLEKKNSEKIRKIILHGSVARGDFGKNSDIDLFIDTMDKDTVDKISKSSLNSFQSLVNKKWDLKGVDIPISVVVGDLNSSKWKDLKEEMASNSVTLYGDSGIMPEKMSHNYIISYSMNNIRQNEKMKLVRSLFGYSTKIKGKTYVHKGLISKISAQKMDDSMIIREGDLRTVLDLLKKHKAKYKIEDTWMVR